MWDNIVPRMHSILESLNGPEEAEWQKVVEIVLNVLNVNKDLQDKDKLQRIKRQ